MSPVAQLAIAMLLSLRIPDDDLSTVNRHFLPGRLVGRLQISSLFLTVLLETRVAAILRCREMLIITALFCLHIGTDSLHGDDDHARSSTWRHVMDEL